MNSIYFSFVLSIAQGVYRITFIDSTKGMDDFPQYYFAHFIQYLILLRYILSNLSD